MRVGAVYPQTELGGKADAVRLIGDALEGLGYDHLLAYDHVLGADHAGRQPELWGPYTERDPFHDPLVLFAYLAGRTTTLEFVSGILILPQRQTALVAKQCADLAVLAGGRLRLGVGTGWNWVEFEALGVPYDDRGPRMDEQVEVLRRLWTEDLVDFRGEFHRIDRANVLPLPEAAPEIWMGGFSKPAFRRAARIGDGFIFAGAQGPVREHLSLLQDELAAHGRDPSGFGLERTINTKRGPGAAAEQVHEWEEMGGTHVSILTMNLGLETPAAHLDYLEKFATELGRG